MSRHIIVDIETIPDPALPWLGDETHFASPPHWQIACLGILVLEDWRPVQMKVLTGDEPDILRSFFGPLGAKDTLVTWNGRGFDLPVIIARALKHAVPMEWYFRSRDYRYRYSVAGHLDLCDQLCDHGAGRRWSLDAAAKLIGWPGKIDTSGGDVADLYAAGDIERIGSYCLEDVVQTAAVLLRSALLFGWLDADAAAEREDALKRFVAADNRVSRLLGGE